MNFVYYLHNEVSQDAFEAKLLWLKKRYNLISNEDIEDSLYEGRRLQNACHLTIDDGWLSTYRVIFPVLKKYNVPVTIFVSPLVAETGINFWYTDYKDCDEAIIRTMLVERHLFSSKMESQPLDLIFKELEIDDVVNLIQDCRMKQNLPTKERCFVNVDELREMQASGLVEVGAHTMIHPVLANETTGRSLKEIKDSIEGLQTMLDKEIRTFAYPNGLYGLDFTQREIDNVKACGIKTAFSVDPDAISKNTNPFNIPRVGSLSRLKLGRLGLYLPSLHDQVKPREAIRKFKL